MYHQEHKIAQAEFAAFLAKFNRQPAEGITVQVPNLFDRMVDALKGILTGRKPQPKVVQMHGAPAK